MLERTETGYVSSAGPCPGLSLKAEETGHKTVNELHHQMPKKKVTEPMAVGTLRRALWENKGLVPRVLHPVLPAFTHLDTREFGDLSLG